MSHLEAIQIIDARLADGTPLLRGQPVGHAVKDFNERYASLSTELNTKLENMGFGATVPDVDLASNWVERNDAEGYAVIGDPAARLRVDDLV